MKPDRYEVDANGCWVWTGPINNKGYGKIGTRYAHRDAYEAKHGPIPPGATIDHLCRNRACVNPDHLEAVTPAENQRRSPLVTKLSPDDVRAIRASTESSYVIATRYGIDNAHAWRIKTRHRQGSVPDHPLQGERPV